MNGIYRRRSGGVSISPATSRLVNEVVGGWRVAFIGNWQSGFWISVLVTNTCSGLSLDAFNG
jgi:hypothetical protein